MDSGNKKVLVLGGGVAGLTAALEIARCNIRVEIIEKKPFLGGHAVQFACKATGACVSCGACIVEDKLIAALSHPFIEITSNSCLTGFLPSSRWVADIQKGPQHVAPEKCNRCGVCLQKCPHPGAILPGFSGSHMPFVTDACAYLKNQSCTLCQELCPSGAINLQNKGSRYQVETDAVVIATGFQPFNPENKPYGYHRFSDVVTSLDLENMLKRPAVVRRPSDGAFPQRIAFIQCVGSRDIKQHHLWCSQVCCASALRMAMRIKNRQPEVQITFFYIDIQTFGSNFQTHLTELRQHIDLVRAIPADVFKTDDQRLRLTFFDNRTRRLVDDIFDLVVLSVGIQPGADAVRLAGIFDLKLAESGFFSAQDAAATAGATGIFIAGTACGPMNIAETVIQATQTAFKTVQFLKR